VWSALAVCAFLGKILILCIDISTCLDIWIYEEMIMDREMTLLPEEKLRCAAECLKVMAHPVRLRIVDLLMQGEFPVHEIAELCGTSPHQTCEHLRLLQGHAFLASERRGRTVYYRIASPRLPKLLECIRSTCESQEDT